MPVETIKVSKLGLDELLERMHPVSKEPIVREWSKGFLGTLAHGLPFCVRGGDKLEIHFKDQEVFLRFSKISFEGQEQFFKHLEENFNRPKHRANVESFDVLHLKVPWTSDRPRTLEIKRTQESSSEWVNPNNWVFHIKLI